MFQAQEEVLGLKRSSFKCASGSWTLHWVLTYLLQETSFNSALTWLQSWRHLDLLYSIMAEKCFPALENHLAWMDLLVSDESTPGMSVKGWEALVLRFCLWDPSTSKVKEQRSAFSSSCSIIVQHNSVETALPAQLLFPSADVDLPPVGGGWALVCFRYRTPGLDAGRHVVETGR